MTSTTDITAHHLEAALIDQNAAGVFRGKRYAFVAVFEGNRDWRLGVAVENERGYSPVDGKSFTTSAEAHEWADGLNRHIGLSVEGALKIITTSMRR